jgi:DNA repair ATPase RecN
MTNEWIPVISDAVKIGLGAIIGGGFSLMSAWFVSNRKLRESQVTDRRQQLREITAELSRIHTLFLHNSSTLAAALPLNDSRTKSAKALRDAIEEHLMELSPEVESALHKLHELEAQLCLMGFESVSALVEAYRFALTSITNLDDSATTADKALFCDAYETQIMEARLITLRTLADAYKNA